MILLYILLAYFAIGWVGGRYAWRLAKRLVEKNVPDWVEGPEDFWYMFFLWPIFAFFYISAAARASDSNFLTWLLCAREPKRVREAEKYKRLEKELEL